MAAPNPYDEILYRTVAAPTTHPDRMATIAVLHGMDPGPVEQSRVLEIGCGDGSNLIPLAFHTPGAAVVGFDLAGQPIASGNEFAAALGLRNLTLVQKDLMEVTPEFGQFDYIICHGMYAWVPPPVQDKLLAVCRQNLAPKGIAAVSYNTHPEAHVRIMIREMILWLGRSAGGPQRREEQSRKFLGFLSRSRSGLGEFGSLVARSASRLKGLSRDALLHDDLGDEYRPAYFHEFADHASRHGLQYVGEADFTAMDDGLLTPEELEALRDVPGDPEIVKEQYLDFLKGRGFRHTLLCRREDPVRRPPALPAENRLFAATRAKPVPAAGSGAQMELRTPDGVSMKTEHPVMKRLFACLGETWPGSVRVNDIPFDGVTPEQRQEILLGLLKAGLIEMSTLPPAFVREPGPRPSVNALVRLQLQRGDMITNLLHRQVRLEGDLTKAIVRLLDGTRDRAALLRDLLTVDPKLTAQALDDGLRKLAGLAILTA
jgi:SAM-dependent methyltransferase